LIFSQPLSRLTAGVEAAKAAPTVEDEEELQSNRALPLINLLTAAVKEGCDVMWK